METFSILGNRYPDRTPQLLHQNPFELLIATILAAQCTDRQVNLVTPVLFASWPTPDALACAPQNEVETVIRSTGFYKNKANHIRSCAQALCREHGGIVPETIEALTRLPGVGRKTANVVLSTVFGVPAVVVDTHVGRIAGRLGWTKSKDPKQIERHLQEGFPPDLWSEIAPVLIRFGRDICTARKPRCGKCPVHTTCPHPDKTT